MKDKDIYPVIYNGKLYKEEECDEIFVMMYEFQEQLNSESGIYLAENMWIYPDGTIEEY